MLLENLQEMIAKLKDDSRADGVLSVVLNMLKKHYSFDQIADATGFSVPEVERIAAEHSLN